MTPSLSLEEETVHGLDPLGKNRKGIQLQRWNHKVSHGKENLCTYTNAAWFLVIRKNFEMTFAQAKRSNQSEKALDIAQ